MSERGHYGTAARLHRVGGDAVAIEPRYAALRRAVKAIFYLQDQVHAPLYVYAEVNGVISARPAQSSDEAGALYAALERAPGEIYVAVFDVSSPYWPDPAYSAYRAAPLERSTVASRARGQGRVNVGLKLFHLPSDSDTAVRQIDTEMNAIVDAMYHAMGADPTVRKPSWSLEQLNKAIAKEGKLPREARRDPVWKEMDDWKEQVIANKAIAARSPLWPFFMSAVSPIYDEWQQFRAADKYYTYFTSWEEYEKWLERAKQLRDTVRARGVKIETPAPVDLTKTLGAEGAEGLAGVVSILKWGVVGVLGIGAVVVLSNAASSLRSGRRAARAALPRAPQRALPAESSG